MAVAATYKVKVLAYNVLPSRALLVVVPPGAAALSSFMRVVQARYTRFLHAGGFRGRPIRGRFASCPLDIPTALEAVKYVESQAVVEGLCARPWTYAACRAAARNGKPGGLLSRDPAVTGRVRNWQRWHKDPLSPDRSAYLALRMRTRQARRRGEVHPHRREEVRHQPLPQTRPPPRLRQESRKPTKR